MQPVEQAPRDVVGKSLERVATDDELRPRLGVVAMLAAGTGRARVAHLRALKQVPRDVLRTHDVAVGAAPPAARAASRRSAASSRVTSWPFSRFQMTKPQPGFFRLFQLVHP